MTVVTTDGASVHAQATNIDFAFIPGDPIDVLVPILDGDCDPVEIAVEEVGAWSARAEVRRHWAASAVLHLWDTTLPNCVIVPGTAAYVHLLATAATTALWQSWPELAAHYDLQVAAPGIEPQTIATGRIRLRPQYTG